MCGRVLGLSVCARGSLGRLDSNLSSGIHIVCPNVQPLSCNWALGLTTDGHSTATTHSRPCWVGGTIAPVALISISVVSADFLVNCNAFSMDLFSVTTGTSA
jgi:hypothetical protein